LTNERFSTGPGHTLWWCALKDLTAVLVVLDQDSKSSDILQLIPTGL